MANSGYFSTNKYNGDIGLYFSWTSSQDIVNNTTTIRWNLYSNGGSGGDWWWAGPVTVTIDGKAVYSYTKRFKLYGDASYHKSGTVVIPHNDDGTKTVSMSVKAAIYSASVNCTGSKNYTLDTIVGSPFITRILDIENHRYVEITNFNDEIERAILEVNNPTDRAIMGLNVRACWGDMIWTPHGDDYEYSTGWSERVIDLSPKRTDIIIELNIIEFSDSDRRYFGSAAGETASQVDVHFQVARLYGSQGAYDLICEKVVKLNIIPAEPSPRNISYQDTNSEIVAITGGEIVQGQSTLEINVSKGSATTLKGSKIVAYKLDFNGETYEAEIPSGVVPVNLLTLEKPDFSGTITATVTIIDGRGDVGSDSIDIPIVAWRPPSAEITCERVNGFESNTTLNVNATISTVTGSTLSITERHKEAPSGTWSTEQTISNNTDVTLSLENQKEWIVEVAVSDAFETTTYTIAVGRGIPIAFIDRDMRSIAINGFPSNNNELYVDGNIRSAIEKNTTASDCLTQAGGNSSVQSVEYTRACMVNQLSITLRTTGAISSGSNIWSGSLGDAITAHKPTASALGGGFYNALNIGAILKDTGELTIRNASPSSIASGATVTVSIIWLSI